MSEEHKKDQLLDHEFDGIREYDNKIPLWLNLIFLASVIFAIGYIPYYHFYDGRLPRDEYAAEMKAAQTVQEAQAEVAAAIDLSTLIGNAEAIAAGNIVFMQNCLACHGPDAKGKGGILGPAAIGPNLTDGEWIHQGTIEGIVGTITNGVLAKGMPTWGPVLGSQKIHEVAAYVHSLGGGK